MAWFVNVLTEAGTILTLNTVPIDSISVDQEVGTTSFLVNTGVLVVLGEHNVNDVKPLAAPNRSQAVSVLLCQAGMDRCHSQAVRGVTSVSCHVKK